MLFFAGLRRNKAWISPSSSGSMKCTSATRPELGPFSRNISWRACLRRIVTSVSGAIESTSRAKINTHPPEEIAHFLHEEDIAPEQIGNYKKTFHRNFLARWMAETGTVGRTLSEVWRIREECIAALSR